MDRAALDAALATSAEWGATTVCLAVIDADGVIATRGPVDAPLPWASVTKPVSALCILEGVRRGHLGLDDLAGPPGATVRHLLAHAAGFAFDSHAVLATPGRTRIYSNTGFDEAAGLLETATGEPFAALVRDWVLAPLDMDATRLEGRPSAGLVGPLADLARLGRELLAPRTVAADDLALATTVAFPGLRGVLPGFGLQAANDWGLGFELRGAKQPHWTGRRNSAATFGHFGRSGTFLWVDPVAGIALACLTDREFGPWAAAAWPVLSDAVLEAAGVAGALDGDVESDVDPGAAGPSG